MLTKAGQYAVRSTLFLAAHSNKDKRVNVKQIAKELDVPSPFLAKLLQQLSKAGLVSSVKGPNGGFYFSEEDKKNTLWDVIKAIDGGHKFEECFVGRSKCNSANPCAFHELAIDFRDKLMHQFQDKTFQTLVSELNSSLF